MTADLQNPIFTDEEAARQALEAVRWPNGPVCPHCGANERIAKVEGTKKSHRPGLYYCNECKGQFTVKVGSIFEDSKLPLTKWWLATYLLCSSKKGISSHQLHRVLGVTYKTAWFMSHRIREAMRDGTFSAGPLGGENKVVEADETYIGGKEKNKPLSKRRVDGKRGPVGKEPVVSLVERDGAVRSFHTPDVTGKTLKPILTAHFDKRSYLMTDESGLYTTIGGSFAGHGTVNHSIEEYVRGGFWHTNTVEGYFSILKRGVVGVYHHVSQQHLKRYLGEFDFRYNTRMACGVSDMERTNKALAGIGGKRLTYRRSGERSVGHA